MEDLSKRHNEEASRIDFMGIVNSLPLVVWTANPDGGLTYISRQWEDIYGNPLSQSLGNGWANFVHPDDVEKAGALWASSLRTGQNYETEFRVQHKKMGYQWILVRALPNYNNDGEIISWYGSNTDINEKKLSEEAARESEKRSQESDAKYRLLIEEAPVATALFVGRDMVIELANEKVIEIWGRGNGVIGMPLAQALPELIGTPFLKILDDVFTTGESFEAKATFCELVIEGNSKAFYFDFTYQAVRNSAGEIYGILDMAIDVTEQVLAQQKIEKSQQELLAMFEDSPVGIAMITADGLVFSMVNKFYSSLTGRAPADLVGKPLLIAMPELKGQGFNDLLQKVIDTKSPIKFTELPTNIMHDGQLETIFIDFTYQPRIEPDGRVSSILVVVVDVTNQVLTRKKIQEAEEKARLAINSAELGFYEVFYASEEMITDARFKEIWDVDHSVLRHEYAAVLHPEDLPHRNRAHEESVKTGYLDYKARIIWKDKSVHWVKVTGKVIYDDEGQPLKLIGIIQDITDSVLFQKKIEESEQNLRNVILQAPVAMCILKGKDFVVELANDLMFELWGKSSAELTGKPIFKALSEAKDQGFEALLEGVYNSGERFSAYGVPITLPRDGKPENIFINFLYEAYRESDGTISGVLAVATDVTEQVTARKKIEEAEIFLRGAIELADLGTWSLDLKTRTLDYDLRLRNWFGFSADEIIDVERAYSPIAEEDRHLVKEGMTHAVTPGTDGIYNVEYKIKNLNDGSVRIIHAQGKAIVGDKNEAYKVSGTAQDVTNERNIEIELTRQVQQRTEELAASNEEMQATNEEMAATNEELEEANVKLHSSNAELEQFAYIASHDLQEPVRKISTFTQMLENSLGDISDKSKNYIDKINSSTDRMTVLIRDVLAYSQLSGINEQYERVNLNQVIEEIKTDFELSIEQKNAVIKHSGLPIIEAIHLQMSQLFSNLLSNSLKYSQPDVPPVINITTELLTKEEVTKYTFLDQRKSYFKIQFSDNGIGIKAEQIDRIFNIFQRLHAKTEYAGTGIGLSICKKIVLNHHGNITAISTDGNGTTFNIILPKHFRKRTE